MDDETCDDCKNKLDEFLYCKNCDIGYITCRYCDYDHEDEQKGIECDICKKYTCVLCYPNDKHIYGKISIICKECFQHLDVRKFENFSGDAESFLKKEN